MNIEDLVQLLNNRLREFELSRDYAKMRGDLERMNDADEEVIALEDTLYKLNLLVDTSKSAAVKEATLTKVMTMVQSRSWVNTTFLFTLLIFCTKKK